jgi:hypothetical protein
MRLEASNALSSPFQPSILTRLVGFGGKMSEVLLEASSLKGAKGSVRGDRNRQDLQGLGAATPH